MTQSSGAPSKTDTGGRASSVPSSTVVDPARAAKTSEAPRRPWRDNIEAVTMAIVMAVMLKYFIVEAYKIPTGSMQPTLMGNDETGIFDRIIVDKLSFHFRDPERFEVVVFKYPLDRSKNFIKRLCGMPNEWLKVDSGDLWTRKGDNDEWTILRRPAPVQHEVWKRINPADPRFSHWKTDSARWTSHARESVEARGEGSARIPNDDGSVIDSYQDGYPGKLGSLFKRIPPSGHAVGDIRLEGKIEALAGCKLVTIELREGARHYKFELPGPAASDDARPAIRTDGVPASRDSKLTNSVTAAQPWKLGAGKSVRFAVQNMDDMLELDLSGDKLLELEIPSAADQASSFTVQQEGEGADFDDLQTFRDIYYTTEMMRVTQFKIPENCYVMLGDNTQDSSDSREWQLGTYKVDGEAIRGNWRPHDQNAANPAQIAGEAEGMRIFFRDEWGELHTFFPKPGSGPELEPAPYVPRNLIVGRAVIVFWPLWPFVPSIDMSRMKWVR